MNIAHCLTLTRIVISPLFPILYLGYSWLGIPLTWVPYILLALLTICEFSDFFDGFFARRMNLVTDLGKVLDPMADSVTHITLFLTFTQGVVGLPLLLVFIFLYRDLFISTLRTLCALRSVALAARLSGKLKTAIQAVVSFLIVFLMIFYTHDLISLRIFQNVSLFLVAIAAFCTLASVIDYVIANRVYIKKALE